MDQAAPPPVGATPRQITTLLRFEGLAAAVLAVVAYAEWGDGWWAFAALVLAPDLAALGYLAGRRAGATLYNIAHWYALPVLLAVVAIVSDNELSLNLALIWAAHIGVDRAIGYGLKYPDDPRRTHLGTRARRNARQPT